MAQFADGDYSKIANDLMSKDAGYIKKFVNGLGDNQKMKDSLAGAFLKRQLEEAANDGRRFSDKVFRTEGTSERLKAIVGEERFAQMQKVDGVIDQLLKTRNITSGTDTAAQLSMKGQGINVPTDKAGLVDMVRKKIAPACSRWCSATRERGAVQSTPFHRRRVQAARKDQHENQVRRPEGDAGHR